MEAHEKTPDWFDNVVYGACVVICIIADALTDAWHWFECPAPDQPRPDQPLPWLSDRSIWTLALLALGITLISLGYAHYGAPP